MYCAASLNQTPLDFEGNFQRIVQAIHLAKESGNQLLCTPELSICGIGCGRHLLRQEVQQQSMDILLRLLPETDHIAVVVGLPILFEGRLFNAAAVIADRKIVSIQFKTIVGENGFNQSEANWFTPWFFGKTDKMEIAGRKVPVGDFYAVSMKVSLPKLERTKEKPCAFIELQVRIGEMRPWKKYGEMIYVIAHLGATPFSFGSFEDTCKMGGKATEFGGNSYLFANYLGCESGQYLYDGGSVVMFDKKIDSQVTRFAYSDVQLVESVYDEQIAENSNQYLYPKRKKNEEVKFQDFGEMVPLGLFDYMRKSKSKGFVLSLSGGADSGCIAVLVARGIKNAWNQLGREQFIRKLDYFQGLQNCQTVEEATAMLLTCVYQGTENSSDRTERAARELALALGAAYHSVKIQEMVDLYTQTFGPLLDRPINRDSDDIALQNIQARARVPGIWFLANLKGAILLNTGNRSEATVGYSTMDGDSCGALSPLGNIDKNFLRNWLRWAENAWEIPALKLINEQIPTAELRPIDCAQTDEQDLMPYNILNRFEQLLIVQSLSVTESVKLLHEELVNVAKKQETGISPSYTTEQLTAWAEKLLRLWKRNQWKHSRYAMSFQLDSSTLPAAMWTDFPNLTGE